MAEMFEVERSRENEESHIVGNWLQHLRRCVLPSERYAFSEALKTASIKFDQIENRKNLSLPKLDTVLRVMHEKVPDILFRLYKQVSMLDLEVLGYAALSSRTVGKAFDVLTRFHDLTSDLYDLVIERGDKEVFVFPVPRPGYVGDLLYIAEENTTGIWNIMRTLVEQEDMLARCRVTFDYSPPATKEYYEQYFDCPVIFDAPRTGIYMPAEIGDMPLNSANRATAEICSVICDRIIPKTRAREDLRRAVQRLLLSRPGERILKLEEAASELALSISQLRKGLYRLGTSYKKVVLEVRMSLAKHYLAETRLNIDEIAYLLDYSHGGAFSRAFKTEIGFPPVEYRRKMTVFDTSPLK